MQQLHLVGFTTDHDSLIFSGRKGAKSGGFVLRLDDDLLATIAEAVRRRNVEGDDLDVPPELLAPAPPPPRRQSQLNPREIQDRLRAGRSLEAIAAEAGVGEEWVARFAAPVEAERRQVIGRVRELTYAKPRRGDSAEALGLSVRWNLAERGVRFTNDEYADAWSAYQFADHVWMVTFTFVSRKRTQVAEWEVDLATGDLVGRNRLASDLGYVEGGRRRRSMASLQPAAPLRTKGARRAGGALMNGEAPAPPPADPGVALAPPSPAARPASKRATRPSPVKKPAPARPAATKKAPAGRARAGQAPAKKAAAKKSAVKRAPAKTPAKRAPAKRAAAKKAPAKRAPARKAPAPPRRAAGTVRRTAKATGGSSRARGPRARGAPPAAPPPLEVERPAPNELSRRRMQLVSQPSPAPLALRTPPRPRAPSPVAAPVRIAAERPAALRSDPPPAPAPATAPPPAAAPAAPPSAPRVGPPDAEDDAMAEERRAERRRARAAARAAAEAPPPVPPSSSPLDVPPVDGPVVTIRANRAASPLTAADGAGGTVTTNDRPALRPAQPAVQPRRRRFSRTTR